MAVLVFCENNRLHLTTLSVSFVKSVKSALGLLLASAAIASADCEPSSVKFCQGTAQTQNLSSTYVCGDYRLGPVQLPSHPPSDSLLEVYDRFGGLCPGQFLATYYDSTAKSWKYPDFEGFQLDTAGETISAEMTLQVGLLIDRSGSEYGSYASPASAPYMQRALPPSNLDTPASNPVFPYNYHVYRVIQSFEVEAGPIAPWFGQPGQGVQYKLNGTILSLINDGFVERVNITLG
ncbi:hypothetical protein CMQ_2319 [Grosmannia clavigera kw1407]|uniref:TNT domain-containing protein n=1 Tax=Grosmannia clavigera (strain kw1407 / UAMH 11150) TaxID=655863 RepID=F0XIU2_GROCL|nr:uncharacterized protein CMQ_2319 [Grosmannia clavigera kw1407]EFX02270.1 hypothetical protein CMQ_2319 [Grosmannia clavigera kw1407]